MPRTAPPLGVAEHIKALELHGYTLLPGLLDPEQVGELREAVNTIELRHSTYTDKQWYAHGVQWSESPAIWRLIQHPAATAFLGENWCALESATHAPIPAIRVCRFTRIATLTAQASWGRSARHQYSSVSCTT